ncbi:thioredoxin family protein [Paenibacillus sp. N3/727]|uniref:TlpA family protein disulfide reductase n=1 Tax=Paenibacillus sp. N3/727 TaxID=2925845 RepID=UPI001F53A92C|nr:thioredoxin family protein [Paenibacillus sp. N3/727]UNK17246.1 thioredoxin family protein [Paenibacillus sp. N3/727]
MSIFDISYLVLWAIIAVQTYYIVQIGKKKVVTTANNQMEFSLVEENHGIAKGKVFPQQQFDSINHGSFDLQRTRKSGGYLVAFTSVRCASCKLVYPLLKNFHEQHTDVQVVVLMQGDEESILQNIQDYELNMPVVQIAPSDMQRLETGHYPFFYYLDSTTQVRTKSIINHEGQLKRLVEEGRLKTAV